MKEHNFIDAFQSGLCHFEFVIDDMTKFTIRRELNVPVYHLDCLKKLFPSCDFNIPVFSFSEPSLSECLSIMCRFAPADELLFRLYETAQANDRLTFKVIKENNQ